MSERPYSYSQVSKYLRCPYAYYLQYRMRKRSDVGPYAHLGSAVHKAMEVAFLDRGANYTQLMQIVEGEINKRVQSPAMRVKLFKEADGMMRLVNLASLFNGASSSEERLTISRTPTDGSAPYEVLSIIDLIAESSEGRAGVIFDYKTDREMGTGRHQLQLSLYRAAFMLHRGYEKSSCHIYYLRHQQYERVPHFAASDVWKIMDASVANIRAGAWSAKPSSQNCNKPWKCDMKPYCEYYQR